MLPEILNASVLRAALDLAPIGICVVHKNGKVLGANQLASKLVGMDESELTQISKGDLWRHIEDLNRLQLRIEIVPAESNDQTSEAVLFYFIDRSKQSELEKSLQRSQAEMKSLFDSSPFYMGILDLTEKGFLHVMDSASVSKYFDVGDGETSGKLSKDLQATPENQRLWIASAETCLRTKRPVQFEFTSRRGPGHLRYFSSYLFYIGETAQGTARFSYATEEITERKDLERKREEQSTKLSHLSKMSALGEMASGIAHEVYNPLTIVKGFADLIEKRNAEGTLNQSSLKTLVNEIQNTCRRMKDIIEGLRFFAREGTQDPMRETDVDTLITATARLCAERFKKHGVNLEIETQEPNARIFCRDVQISQVILNLLNNAFDAVKNETERCIRIKTELVDGYLTILLSDTGRGIPENIQSKIFEPFFTTKAVGQGTGMGLSICKGIMESHHGSIKLVASSHGAHFLLRLPQGKSYD